ncbi:MAG: hypothetical protein WBK77_06670 [Alphaproteobacteria bacterium]
MSEESKKSQPPQEVSRAPGRTGVGNPVKFDNNIDIYPDAILPEYDIGEIKAYRASGRDKGNYFALICERHLIPRLSAIPNYSSINNICSVPLVTSGAVFWPLVGQQRYVLIYKDVLGKRLLRNNEHALGWRQDDVINVVVKPMIQLLQEFKNRDFAHGSIRPGNMFCDTSTIKPEKITLGECLATPSSYDQPVLYQTIERGSVMPIARGEATPADDIYAFGVSLAVFMRSNDPLEGMTDQEIIRAKIEQGSYSAITGKERFKGSILELLRGVLHDDPLQRWTPEEVMVWMDGRRLSPKQSIKEKKAPRPIIFSGQKYYQSTLLSMSLDADPADVVRMTESGDLEQWLTRSVEDDLALERVDLALKATRERGTGPGYEDRLVSNLSVALDPRAALRYRGLRMMGDGVGTALAQAYVLRQDIQPFAEIFVQNIAYNWITMQQNPSIDVGFLISRFDNCRNFIRHGKLGYGLERAVYVLCPEVHCLSDKLADYFVITPEDMVMAFEDICRRGKAPTHFFDRHSAAFLSVKDAKVIDSFLFDLGSKEENKKLLGSLKCIATIQKRSILPPLQGISKTFMDNIDVICSRFHDSEVRNSIKKSMARFAAEGDVVNMAAILSSPDIHERDMAGFRAAMREYITLAREFQVFEVRLADSDNFGKATGREIAAVVSSVVAVIVTIISTLMYFGQIPGL